MEKNFGKRITLIINPSSSIFDWIQKKTMASYLLSRDLPLDILKCLWSDALYILHLVNAAERPGVDDPF